MAARLVAAAAAAVAATATAAAATTTATTSTTPEATATAAATTQAAVATTTRGTKIKRPENAPRMPKERARVWPPPPQQPSMQKSAPCDAHWRAKVVEPSPPQQRHRASSSRQRRHQSKKKKPPTKDRKTKQKAVLPKICLDDARTTARARDHKPKPPRARAEWLVSGFLCEAQRCRRWPSARARARRALSRPLARRGRSHLLRSLSPICYDC